LCRWAAESSFASAIDGITVRSSVEAEERNAAGDPHVRMDADAALTVFPFASPSYVLRRRPDETV